MRLLFAGTPEFAALSLAAIADAGHEVALVLTQPDRPAGRGQKLTQSPVKREALRRNLEVFQPPSLRDAMAQSRLVESKACTMVVAAYGLILPQAVLDSFPLGCINIHASLLPRWRGAAPIQRAILAGDKASGICIMKMDAALDTGPVILSHSLPIGPEETGGSLHDRLAQLGSELIVKALAGLEAGDIHTVPQPTEGVTYASKLTKEEAQIDWLRSARHIHAQVRAFNPVPVCFTRLAGAPLKIWRTQWNGDIRKQAVPGEILAVHPDRLEVACGEGVLSILELQKAGGTRQDVSDYLRGSPVTPGTILGT